MGRTHDTKAPVCALSMWIARFARYREFGIVPRAGPPLAPLPEKIQPQFDRVPPFRKGISSQTPPLPMQLAETKRLPPFFHRVIPVISTDAERQRFPLSQEKSRGISFNAPRGQGAKQDTCNEPPSTHPIRDRRLRCDQGDLGHLSQRPPCDPCPSSGFPHRSRIRRNRMVHVRAPLHHA